MTLSGSVVVVAGAGGGAGAAVVHRLALAGATVVMANRTLESLDQLTADVAAAGGTAHPYAIDLVDEAATAAWAASVVTEFGRVDGLVHLVGGWRGGKGITETDLADWNWLADLLVRTVQNTTRGFHDALRASPNGRFVLVSAAEASHPTAKNASYAAAKAAAETWTLAVADSFRDSPAAATIIVVKALLTPEMRAAKPDKVFNGYTDVADLAEAIADLWEKPATELNGVREWMTE